ncbi:hypothetical protein [Aestuariivirga litoralis]|uniref:hypothetical protein n=1 Tax=Aestuariivirga litoralis TaxID=2650924 RepID=UPI0018C5F177|nr:hypothetical protein [Aestuariivirga litoralis]MBG1231734.1 hypothetical protein [Aestuariivirga litoralis]
MQKLDRTYITVGMIWLIAGMIFGAWLGGSGHMNFANSHAHINLLGFVVSTLFGLLYWAFPAMARSKVAMWQFLVYEIGILMLIIGKIMIDNDGKETIFLQLGSVVTIVGTAMMLYLFVTKSGSEARA